MQEKREPIWEDIDADEQEFLDRISNFGEGYYDLSVYEEHNEKIKENGSEEA